VKNVAFVSHKRQPQGFTAHTGQNGLRFDLWIEPTTLLSGLLIALLVAGFPLLRLPYEGPAPLSLGAVGEAQVSFPE